jgi:hypothetical protein
LGQNCPYKETWVWILEQKTLSAGSHRAPNPYHGGVAGREVCVRGRLLLLFGLGVGYLRYDAVLLEMVCKMRALGDVPVGRVAFKWAPVLWGAETTILLCIAQSRRLEQGKKKTVDCSLRKTMSLQQQLQ